MNPLITTITSGAAKGLLEGAGSLIQSVRTAITGKPSAEKLMEAERALMELEFRITEGQAEINKIEAAHPNLFIAGWRPFIGWVCGASLAYHFIGYPVLLWASAMWFPDVSPPMLPTNSLMPLVLGLLGMGGYRTFEKLRGVSEKH